MFLLLIEYDYIASFEMHCWVILSDVLDLRGDLNEVFNV